MVQMLEMIQFLGITRNLPTIT